MDNLATKSLVPLPGARWYALNLLAELDSEGEYYIDRQAGLLYFMPPAGEGKLADGVRGAFVSHEDNALHLRGVEYVSLEKLAVSHSRLSGINASAVSHVSSEAPTSRDASHDGASHRFITRACCATRSGLETASSPTQAATAST